MGSAASTSALLARQSLAISDSDPLAKTIFSNNGGGSAAAFSLMCPVHLVSDYVCLRRFYDLTFLQVWIIL